MAGSEAEESATRETRAWLCRAATYASVTVATVLILAKVAAYLATGAVAVLASLIDSATDLFASVVILLGVRLALRPPDRHHRFGHGKAEPLAALVQAAFVTGSSLFLVIEAISRLVSPQPLADGRIAIAAMVLAIVLTGLLVAFQNHVIRRTGSVAISADRLHYVGDLLMNASVIAALVLTSVTGQTVWDSIFGLVIAVILLRGAWRIGGEALDILMDRELPDADRATITAIVCRHDDARGLHDLRTRRTGGGRFIELHLELDADLTLGRVHDITDEIEAMLRATYPDAEITIHQEPAGLEDERLDDRIVEDSPVLPASLETSR